MNSREGKKSFRRPSSKRAVITERDMDIFRMLSSGPATFIQIRLGMEKIYKREMSEAVLWTRLSKLKGSRYIKSRRYASSEGQGRFSLYSLSLLSIGLLVKAGYPAGSLRAGLPDDVALAREMRVTTVVRAIKKEGARLYEYQIADKRTLKQAAEGAGKAACPDLHVRLIFHASGKRLVRVFDMEIDDGAVLPAHAARRISRLSPHTVVVLCAVEQRMDAVRRAVVSRHSPNIPGKLFFGLLSDFARNGFMGTGWLDAGGRSTTLIGPQVRA